MRNPLKFLPLHIKWLFFSSFFQDFFCLGFLQFEYYVPRCTFFGMYLCVLWVLGVCGRCVSLTLKTSWPLLLQMFFSSLLHPSHRGISIMPVTPFEIIPQFFDSLLFFTFCFLFAFQFEMFLRAHWCVPELCPVADEPSRAILHFCQCLWFVAFPFVLRVSISAYIAHLFWHVAAVSIRALKIWVMIIKIPSDNSVSVSHSDASFVSPDCFACLLAGLVICCWKSGTCKRQKERWQVGCREKPRVKLTRSCLTSAAASGIHFLQCPYFPLLFWSFPKKLLLNWDLCLGAPAPKHCYPGAPTPPERRWGSLSCD